MHEGRVVLGAGGTVVLPSAADRRATSSSARTATTSAASASSCRPTRQPTKTCYIPEGENGGAITGDIVRAKITSRGQRDGKAMYSGRITEIVERTQKRFVGSLAKSGGEWIVLPDGNTLTEPILTPDAASGTSSRARRSSSS